MKEKLFKKGIMENLLMIPIDGESKYISESEVLALAKTLWWDPYDFALRYMSERVGWLSLRIRTTALMDNCGYAPTGETFEIVPLYELLPDRSWMCSDINYRKTLASLGYEEVKRRHCLGWINIKVYHKLAT